MFVMLSIVVTMLLIQTLGKAASGLLSPGDITILLGLLVLGYTPLILNVSTFIAVVRTLSRLYRDSEMTVWQASGVSLRRFTLPVFQTFGLVVICAAVCSTWVWPWVYQQRDELKTRFERRSDIARVAPGQFQTSADGRRVFFIEKASSAPETGASSAGEGRSVFILDDRADKEVMTSARRGTLTGTGDSRYLLLRDGERIETLRSDNSQRVIRFQEQRSRVADAAEESQGTNVARALPTLALLDSNLKGAKGELSWRLGIPLASFNLLLLGMGLSATNPRKGTSANLMTAIFCAISYQGSLNLLENWVSAGKIGWLPGVLGLHGTVMALALMLILWRDEHLRWPRIRLWRRRAGKACA